MSGVLRLFPFLQKQDFDGIASGDIEGNFAEQELDLEPHLMVEIGYFVAYLRWRW